LKILENGLIPIYENEGNKIVNGRELHEFLEVGKDFTNWIKDRIEKYGFIENEDFIIFAENGENPGRPKTEYILSMDTAKEISMVQNNEKGSQARKYFIAIEKKFREIVKPSCIEDVLIQSLQEMKDIRMQIETVKQESAKTKQEVQAVRDIITLNPQAAWRRECNRILNIIGKQIEDYKKPKDEVYAALKTRANCRPNVLVYNLQGRVAKNGMAPSKIAQLNILDVLENEPRLKEIYVNIVKEMAIKYNVSMRELTYD
jgi:anti-repressor protein